MKEARDIAEPRRTRIKTPFTAFESRVNRELTQSLPLLIDLPNRLDAQGST